MTIAAILMQNKQLIFNINLTKLLHMRSIPLLLLSLLSFLIYSCSSTKQHAPTVYYVCESDTILIVYQYANTDIPIGEIPTKKQLIIKDINQPFQPIEYGVNKGFIKRRTLRIIEQFSPRRLPDYVLNYDDSTYKYVKGYSKGRSKKSETTSGGGTVQVKGYYRKDGTYVKPHTRSAPRRKN